VKYIINYPTCEDSASSPDLPKGGLGVYFIYSKSTVSAFFVGDIVDKNVTLF
jgi:hypothetical protein